MASRILIQNGRIWDGEQFLFADIYIADGLVAEIAEHIEKSADFTYNATGQTVSAGFVDAHAHFRGISASIYGTPADSTCFPFGVTAAVDVSAMKGNQETLEMLAVKAAVLGFIGIKEDKADFTAAEQALANYGDKVIGLKICFSRPEAVTIAPLRQACEYARAKDLPLMVHCTDTPLPMADIVDCLSRGDIMTHPYHGGQNTAMDDDFACLRKAREKGIWLDAGFAGHVHTNFNVLRGAAKAGIFPDTISTDITKLSAFKRGGRYGMTMCMSMCRRVGMPEVDIFRAVTSSPAKMLGKEDKWGCLQVGKPADIAVVRETDESFSLVNRSGVKLESSAGYRCLLTIADGEIVYK